MFDSITVTILLAKTNLNTKLCRSDVDSGSLILNVMLTDFPEA